MKTPNFIANEELPDLNTGCILNTFKDVGILNDDAKTFEVSYGTTIIGLVYEGGVLLACDSRTSSGAYIPSRCTNKIRRITPSVYTCVSGVAAHSQFIVDLTRNSMNTLMLDMKTGSVPPISAAYKMKNTLFTYKEALKAGFIIGGYNFGEKKGEIFQVCPGGSLIDKERFLTAGSGSIFVTGFAEANYRSDFTKDEAKEFLKDCIRTAMKYDSASGGLIRIVDINDKETTEDIITL
eukprot:GAHX01000352.1.p1 GENE.GAHX01000352.1~~GAHX01000352.1.p1  ORF type:complete len:237 (+),score=42.20 GAHX01000352.1:37-747(+)